MNTKVEESSNRFDAIKWILVGAVVALGVGANMVFGEEPLLYRVIGLIILGLIAAAIALQTAKGEAFWELVKASRTEIRKVVWPSHQETLQTTLIVLLAVVVMALILWGLDTALGLAVSKIIG